MARAPLAFAAIVALGLFDGSVTRAQTPHQQLFPPSTLPRRPPDEKLDPKGEFLLQADEIQYDQQNNLVVALGHVQISQGNRVLLADRISYNRKDDVVTATGAVSITEPNGDVAFGDYAELTGPLHDGVIKNFSALLVDNSRIAAAGAERVAGDRKIMTKGVFSPCNLCLEHPERAPIWQLKGERVIHDEVNHEIIYHDATLEMYGVPVFYSPYLSHPDPTVKRRSGFLIPDTGNSKTLGLTFGAPYYGVIDGTSDFTVEPRFMSEEGALLAEEYRKRLTFGSLRVAASLVDGRRVNANGDPISGQRTVRGAVSSEGVFNIDENWRLGFDLERQTDPTYLARYRVNRPFGPVDRFGFTNQLTSDAYVEGFFQRDYAAVSVYDFQPTIRSIDGSTLPRVRPFAEYDFYGERDAWGGRYRVDSSILSLSRSNGVATNRFSSTASYQLPYVDRLGEVWTANASVEADTYGVRHQPLGATGTNLFDGDTHRLFPKLRLDWRYPFASRGEHASYVIEPRIDLVAATKSGNSSKIPNEDSQGFEFSDGNLFSDRRFGGVDLVDTGQRFDYGVAATAYGDSGFNLGGFLGQSYQFERNSVYLPNSGLDTRRSDYVGRVTLVPRDWFDLSYRFRLDQNTLSAQRQEIGAAVYRWGASFGVSYLQYERPTPTDTTSQHPRNINLATNFPLWENVSGYATYARDLASAKSLSQTLGVVYRDECFALSFDYEQNFTTNGDVKPGATFLLRIGFKYLGDVGG